MSQQWPLIKGKARKWPAKAENGMVVLQCHYCLGLFESKDRRRCYCSPECRRAMDNAARRQSAIDQRICPMCHRDFTPRQTNQKWCSPPCRKLAWYYKRKGHDIDVLTQQRRAKKLRHRRCESSQKLFVTGPLKPYRNQVPIINPQDKLPEAVKGQIENILKFKTISESD